MKNTLNKKLFKYRIKLLLCNLKTVILFEFVYLWLFTPLFAGVYLSKVQLPVLGWVLGWQCFIMLYFNIELLPNTNKWFDKIKTQKNELQSSIIELQYLIGK